MGKGHGYRTQKRKNDSAPRIYRMRAQAVGNVIIPNTLQFRKKLLTL